MDKEKGTGCVTSAIARSHSCRLLRVVSSKVRSALAKIQHEGRNLAFDWEGCYITAHSPDSVAYCYRVFIKLPSFLKYTPIA